MASRFRSRGRPSWVDSDRVVRITGPRVDPDGASVSVSRAELSLEGVVGAQEVCPFPEVDLEPRENRVIEQALEQLAAFVEQFRDFRGGSPPALPLSPLERHPSSVSSAADVLTEA